MVRLLAAARCLCAIGSLGLGACGSERPEAARSSPAAAVQELSPPSAPARAAVPDPVVAPATAPEDAPVPVVAPVPAPDTSIPVGLFVGNRAPDFEAVDVHDKRFKLSDYRGKIVALDFWGFW
jgi:hypothetical protein